MSHNYNISQQGWNYLETLYDRGGYVTKTGVIQDPDPNGLTDSNIYDYFPATSMDDPSAVYSLSDGMYYNAYTGPDGGSHLPESTPGTMGWIHDSPYFSYWH